MRWECRRKEVVFLFSLLFSSLAVRFMFSSLLSLYGSIKIKYLFKEMRPFSGRGMCDKQTGLPSNFFLQWWR